MSANLASDPNALTRTLTMLSQPETAVVRQGEKLLKPFLKQTSCILPLINQIRSNPDEAVRHHAALLLKRRISVLYGKFSAPQKQDLKLQILTLMISEPSKSVGVALAGVVASVAKCVLTTEHQWPELFGMLLQLSADPKESMRSLNYSLLEQLAESVAIHLKPHTATLATMFTTGCLDEASAVSTAAMSATASYINALSDDPEVMQLKCVLTPMLGVMHSCFLRGDEELLVDALDVLQECIEMEQPLVNDHIEAIVPFLVTIIQSEKGDAAAKQAAGQTLIIMVENRPKLIAKKDLVTPLLTAMVDMVAKCDSSAAGSLFNSRYEAEDDDDDDDDFSDAMDVHRLAQTIIDSMAMNIPSKYFVQPALTLCSQGMASPDPQMRKAGCAVLGVIAEGCCDAMRQGLSTILPRLLASIQDPEDFVRECACFALGQLSEYCQPEILHYHQTVLPVVFGALEDPKHTVQTTTCYVLEMFCENLRPETLRPFLNPLLTRLATLLQSPQKLTQEMALTAIAATAVAAEIEFLPYTETICSLLAPLLFNTEPKMHTMRGRSLECLGHVAVAIDSEHFERYFETGMQSAMQALLIDNDDLKEHSYVFFANTSKVMGHGFDPYLATLMPHLLGVVTENELITGEGLDDDEDDEEDQNIEDDEGSGEGKDMRLNVHEGFINNKKAALTAIGAMAEYTKESFAPYLESALDSLIVDQMGALYSFHDIIRSEALECLPQLVCVACHATGVTALPNKLQVIVLPDLTAEVIRTAMKYLLMSMADDEAKSPVSTALEAACSIIARVGVACLTLQVTPGEGPRIIDELMARLLVIMNEKAPCQKLSNGDGHGDDEENDHDNVVMDSASELIGTLSKTIGDQMIPFFDQLQKPLMRFMKPNRPFSDRSMAIGCYAEVLLEFGPAALKYVDSLMPFIKVGLADEMESVRRNSAYCIGVLVQATGLALAPHFMSILQSLYPLCTRAADKMASDTGGADVDNALSSVARIINTGGAALIPLAQVLPVMLAALPLRSDTSEGPNIYGCLIDLVMNGDPTSISLLPLILNKFGEVLLADSNAVAEVKERVILCLRAQATGSRELQCTFHVALEQVTDPAIRASIQNAINT